MLFSLITLILNLISLTTVSIIYYKTVHYHSHNNDKTIKIYRINNLIINYLDGSKFRCKDSCTVSIIDDTCTIIPDGTRSCIKD